MIKNNYPLVSVVVITYNQKVFLKECIDSILIQDYKNLEIVVADDGSTDGSQKMLNNFKKNFPNLFVLRLSNKNQGITINSNAAHFACSGKYIFVMGGDDLMLPNKISKQVEFMENNPNCSVCYHNLDVFDSSTNNSNNYEGYLSDVVSFSVFNGACSTVFRRDKTPVHGYDERLPIVSDWLYTMQTLGNGGKIMYIDEVLGKYRKHENNVTKNFHELNSQKDTLNACSILLLNHPELSNKILYRYSEILRGLRIYDNKNYFYYLMASIRVNFNLKSLVLLFIYILSFKTVKK
jgi:glycosyltransferase involved in cell wall biosynthesis